MCVYVCLYFFFFFLLTRSNCYATMYMWIRTFSEIRKGKKSKFALETILFENIFYIFGKVTERNWDYFNENTFINVCFFFLSLVVENSHRSCIELSVAEVFGVILIEQRAFTPRKLSFKYWFMLLYLFHVKFSRIEIICPAR